MLLAGSTACMLILIGETHKRAFSCEIKGKFKKARTQTDRYLMRDTVRTDCGLKTKTKSLLSVKVHPTV